MKLRRADFHKYGFTKGCNKCEWIQNRWWNHEKACHNIECRERIETFLACSDDPVDEKRLAVQKAKEDAFVSAEGERLFCEAVQASRKDGIVIENLVHGDVDLRPTALTPVFAAGIESVQVSNRVVHDTHVLERHRGISWCWRCGARTRGKRLLLLAAPCRGAPTRGLKSGLARLRCGFPPEPGALWPIQPDRNGVVLENNVRDDDDMSVPKPPSGLGAERFVHDTHLLARHEGVSWCWRCGAWAQGWRLLHLAAPCRGSPTRSAMDVLARLRRGSHPQPGKQWSIEPNTTHGVVVENPVHEDIVMSMPASASVSCGERWNHGGPSARPSLTAQKGHEVAASFGVTRMMS